MCHLQVEKHVLWIGAAVTLTEQLDGVTLAHPALRGGWAAQPETHMFRGICGEGQKKRRGGGENGVSPLGRGRWA